MCVIIISEEQRPDLLLLEQAEAANQDGGGIAWREGEKVSYAKGLTAKQIFQLQKTLPLPLVTHFRLATHGGITPLLCHPFPVTKHVALAERGSCPRLLFHNGIWMEWKKHCMEAVIKTGTPFPKGACSDTRAMAWLCALYGTSILNLIEEKVVVFSQRTIEIYGSGWKKHGAHTVSNTNFVSGPIPAYYQRTLATRLAAGGPGQAREKLAG